METENQVCLTWNNHQSTLVSVFETLLDSGALADCTLAADGRYLKAHKVILSSCSPYFAILFSQHYEKYPIVILKDVKFEELRAMMDYMYRGEVNVLQDQLGALLRAAKSLQIKGLSDSCVRDAETNVESSKQKKTSAFLHETRTLSCTSGLSVENGCGTPSTQKPQVVDLSEDSLPLLDSQETCSVVKDRISPVNHIREAQEALSGLHESKLTGIVGSTFTIQDKQGSVCDSSHQLQIPSAQTPLASVPVSKFVSERHPMLTSGDERSQMKSEKTLLSQPELSIHSPQALRIATESAVQELVTRPETSVRAKSEVTDVDDDITDEDTRDFTLGDMIYSEQEEGRPHNGVDCVSNGVSFKRMIDWPEDTYSTLPKSKRPCLSRCSLCGKVYKYNRNLIKHLKYECGKEPQFCCPHCPARYTQNGTLRKHLEKLHQGYSSVK